VAGLPPFSGFWPKAMLVAAALEKSHWWLAATILLSGFLITFAGGRIFLLAFWRAASSETKPSRLPIAPLAALAVLTAASVAAGLWPEPLALLAKSAAYGLHDPETYIRSVFAEPRP
jgi:multicomponent Na+:H+ antiporter subunit D